MKLFPITAPGAEHYGLVFMQVCYADVKPANFLLKDRFPTPAASSLRTQQPCRQLPPDVRVIDFGCAQRVTEGTKLQKRTGACASAAALRRSGQHTELHGVALDSETLDRPSRSRVSG